MGALQNNPTPRKPSKPIAGAVGMSQVMSERGARLWGEVDPARLMRLVRTATSVRAGVLFGVTRDGTSATITLFYQDDRVRFYPHDAAEFEELCDRITYWSDQEAPERQLDFFTE